MIILFVLLIGLDGTESLMSVTGERHEGMTTCYVEKRNYKDADNLKFFCAKEVIYKRGNKQ